LPVVQPAALTVNEAAALLNLSTATVYRLLAKGELPGRKFGNSWRISRDALDAYLKGAPTTTP
jgi:excisionase family DNA binding protein